MHWLKKYKVAFAVNLLIFALMWIISINWQLSPLRIEGINWPRLIHYSVHVILLPLLTIYWPLKLIQRRYHSSKKSYLFGLLLSVLTGFMSATYTHSISTPGSFLFSLEGGAIEESDPRYDPNDSNNNYLMLSISTSVEGYDEPMHSGYFYVEAFLHSLFYCLYVLSYLQVFGILYKRKLTSQLKQQQLDTLQYQLNPHFLFNSLNSIRGMLYEDVREAKKLLKEFRQLFQHHFDNKQHCVTLKQEMLMCKHYLKLEKVRFEERLHVQWQVSEHLTNYLVPNMGLFTLIENAIKHGIAQLPNGGSIHISVTTNNKQLVIDIANTINLDARQADGTRTGLTNLEARLALLYQEHFSLNTERTLNQFSVELIVPLKKGTTA